MDLDDDDGAGLGSKSMSGLGKKAKDARDVAKAAWAGYNLISLQAPRLDDLSAYGPASQVVGRLLDGGYSFGYLVTLEPSSAYTPVLTPSEVIVALKHAGGEDRGAPSPAGWLLR